MKIKKRIKKGVCAAMRCQDPVSRTVGDNVNLCERHAAMYNETAAPEPEPAAPAAKIEKVDDTKAPSEAVIAEIVTPIKKETDDTIAKIQAIEIKSQGMLDTISKILQKVKADLKDLEDKRKSVTKPMLDAKKQIDSWFKPATDSLKECEKIIKNAIAKYIEHQEREKLAALAAGNTSAALAMPAPEIPEGIQTRAIWGYEVLNEKLLPREYLCPDHDEIKRVVSEFKDKTDIPGIRVFLSTSIAAKAAE